MRSGKNRSKASKSPFDNDGDPRNYKKIHVEYEGIYVGADHQIYLDRYIVLYLEGITWQPFWGLELMSSTRKRFISEKLRNEKVSEIKKRRTKKRPLRKNKCYLIPWSALKDYCPHSYPESKITWKAYTHKRMELIEELLLNYKHSFETVDIANGLHCKGGHCAN